MRALLRFHASSLASLVRPQSPCSSVVLCPSSICTANATANAPRSARTGTAFGVRCEEHLLILSWRSPKLPRPVTTTIRSVTRCNFT